MKLKFLDIKSTHQEWYAVLWEKLQVNNVTPNAKELEVL